MIFLKLHSTKMFLLEINFINMVIYTDFNVYKYFVAIVVL